MITLATAEYIAGIAGAVSSITYTITGMEKAGTTETYKVLAQGQLPEVAAAIYTAPTSNVAFVKEILLHNPTAGSVTFKLYVNGTADDHKIGGFILIAGGSATHTSDGWKFFDSSGKLGTTVLPASGVVTTINVQDYGAKGDGTNDDTTSIQAAINAAQLAPGGLVGARGVDVYFPPGIYKTTATLTVQQNNICLQGSGVGSTVILPAATFLVGDVIQFGSGAADFASLGLQDINIYSSVARTSGAHININRCSDVVIQDFAMNNPVVGILVQSTAGHESLKVTIRRGEINNILTTTGVGIQVNNGLGGDTYITDIVSSNAASPNSPLAGINLISTGHTSILRCNITRCIHGLYVNPGASQDVSYLFIDHSLFDSCNTTGAYFWASSATAARIRSVMSVNSWYSGSTANPSYGINFVSAGGTAVIDGFSFIGCRILNNYTQGAWIQAGTNISFTDCTIAGNSAGSSGAADGINIAANLSSISAMNCKIGQAGTAGNTQRYAINVAAGTGGNLQFVYNDCQPNVTLGTHGYVNVGAVTGGGVVVEGNLPVVAKNFGNSSVSSLGALNTAHTIISNSTAAGNRLPVSALKPGLTLRFTASGTNTSTVANATTFKVLMGTANTAGGDAAVFTAAVTSAAGGTTIPFKVVIEITLRTVAAGVGTWYGYMWVFNNGTTGIYTLYTFGIAGTMATCTTTNALYVNLSHQTAAVTTTNTFQTVTTEVVSV